MRVRLTIANSRAVRTVIADEGEWVLLGHVEGRPAWWCSGRLYHGAEWFSWLLWGEWIRFESDAGCVFAACAEVA